MTARAYKHPLLLHRHRNLSSVNPSLSALRIVHIRHNCFPSLLLWGHAKRMNSPSARFRMFRQHSQRYSRASLGKGLKVKHVLQISVIVVVLTWVMYEVNLSIKPAPSVRTGGSAVFDEAEQEAFLSGRTTHKPKDGKFSEKDAATAEVVATDRDEKASTAEEENFDASRTEEDTDDQRDRDIGELDIEHATEQDEKSEDETMVNDAQHDVGSDFEELKNEQARVEQEETRKGGDDDSSSEAQENEVTTTSEDAHPEGGSDDAEVHLEDAVDKEKAARETTAATFMDAFVSDSILKPKLDILDEGKTDNTSRANPDEQRDSAADPLKETTEDSEEKVAEEKSAEEEKSVEQHDDTEKSADQVQEVGEKDAEDEIVETSEEAAVSTETEDNQVEDAHARIVEKTEESVESNEEGKVDDEKRDAQSHSQEQEEKKPEEVLEEKAADTQETPQATEVQKTESTTQPESKTEGADAEVEKKTDEGQAEKDKPEEAHDQSGSDREKERVAAEENIRGSQHKEETEQDHNSGEQKNVSESQQDTTEQKKDESVETNSESISAEASSDSKAEDNTQEDLSAETKKGEALKQVTDSDAAAAGNVDANTKTEDQSAEKSNQEVAKTQEQQAQK